MPSSFLHPLVLSLGLLAGLVGCTSSHHDATPATATFGVLSDTHLHDAAALGASGPDWDAYMAEDRKMLAQSQETLDAALSDLASRKPQFLLFCGDLTKDGERVNHLLMASKLAAIRNQGIKVFVIPGNHDINNPHAVSYLTSPASPVDPVAPEDFRAIYADCGFKGAIATDPNSLSYIAEPVPGLWLFAVDSCDYASNVANGTPTTSGRIPPATLAWITQNLATAKAQGKMVLGMEHHGIVEHFAGQATFFPEYLLTGYESTGKTLADAGLNLMFTGHFHANDIALKDFGSSRLYDCETGSTVTAPCPYRFVNLDLGARSLAISTSTVTSIPSYASPASWTAFENAFLNAGLENLAVGMLTAAPYNVPLAQAQQLAPVFSASLAAHYAGDEKLANAPAAVASTLTALNASTDPLARTLGQFLGSLWTDPAPADNSVTLTLR